MMSSEVKIIIFMLTCCVFSLLLQVINVDKKYRKQQLFVPVIAAFYCLVSTTILLNYKQNIFDYFNKMGLAPMENLNKVPYFYTLDELIDTDVALFNLVILGGFVVLKLLVFIILKLFVKEDTDIPENSESNAYKYDNDGEYWYVKEEWQNFSKMIKYVSYVAVVVASVYIGLSCYFGHNSKLWSHIFVVIPIIILTEISNYLNGLTKSGYSHKVAGVDAVSQHINNFHKMRELYEYLFQKELLVANTSTDQMKFESSNEVIDRLKASSESIKRITGEFFDNNDESNYEKDNLLASVNLVEKRNLIICNPFYRDFGEYIILPIINALLSAGKCLFVLGRNSLTNDVECWIKTLIKDYTKMESLWRIKSLSNKTTDCEIGILSSSALNDLEVIKANYSFFNEVNFVVFIEPSIVVNTSQIALNIISEKINSNGNSANFCVFDKSTDGLVDTLSHIMKTEFVDVYAPPIPKGSHTAMAWNADGDYLRQNLFEKQIDYVGNGVELASVAIKNQIPQVTWYSETKAPVRDIKWIVSQHYPVLCKYMNIPVQQSSITDKIKFESNLWSAEKQEDAFIIAEDEFNNLFITLRAFLTRGTNQTFVNVFSENYLLRDYMRCNAKMFFSNPNAIPSLVTDYARTERNLIIKLVMLMSIREVEEAEVLRELNLTNINTDNVLRTLTELMIKYTNVDEQVISTHAVAGDSASTIKTFYFISQQDYEEHFSKTLKTAYYIVEDDKENTEYIDSKPFSLVTQCVLPNQFLTYNGKYYRTKHISTEKGVVLRRASNLYMKREYYRQIRNYHIENINEKISEKIITDIEFSILQCDFQVKTTGYLQLDSNENLRTAKVVKFTVDEELKTFERTYKNKNILRIKLPDTDDKTRFTLSLLLSELFRSVYPELWQYIAVVSAIPQDVDGVLNYMIYSVNSDIDEEYIYIIEDSYADLGIIDSIEKNMFKFFSIIADFLCWHEEKMREPERKDPVLKGMSAVNDKKEENTKEKSFLSTVAKRFKSLFSKKDNKISEDEEPLKEKNKAIESITESLGKNKNEEAEMKKDGVGGFENIFESADEKGGSDDRILVMNEVDGEEKSLSESSTLECDTCEVENKNSKTDKSIGNIKIEEDYDFSRNDIIYNINAVDGTDIFEGDGIIDDFLFDGEFSKIGLLPITKTRYQNECYLKFGFEEIDARLHIDELERYLQVHGWTTNNSFTLARNRDILVKEGMDFNAENQCDFCGVPISGISFDKLSDGRIRCVDCSNNTISTIEEMETLFYQVLEMLGIFFGIQYKKPISIEMVDAKTLGQSTGHIFQPSKEFAERVLGFAIMNNGKYKILLENGSPKNAAIETLVHEMTHIWQYLNWDTNLFEETYSMPNKECPTNTACNKVIKDIVYEGMAMWASIQYLYQIGETYYASQQEALAENRSDAYGLGFRYYRDKYPIIKDSSLLKYTPFLEFPTIDPAEIIYDISLACSNEEYNC